MKITIFTSNQLRHIHLINSLAKISKECFAIVEGSTIFPGKIKDFYNKSALMKKYFNNVQKAENKFFGNNKFILNKVYSKFIKHGDVNNLKKKDILKALDSDLYIVFGSSYIKGWLANFLVKKKTLNIHMGLSPFYRGSSCNFWAIFDENPQLVGSTIHLLSKGLDSGKILYHALPSQKSKNLYDFTMSSVLSAHLSLVKRIKNKSIFNFKPIKQDRKKEIRYSIKKNFNDKILKEFFKKKKNNAKIKKKINTKIFVKPYSI